MTIIQINSRRKYIVKRKLAALIASLLVGSMLFSACSSDNSNDAQNSGNEKTSQSTNSKEESLEKYDGKLELLTTASWVNENLDDVVILDTRSEKDFGAGHIPGAINVAWQQFSEIEGKNPGDEGWGTLLPAEKLEKSIGALGIDGSKTVVVYGETPKGWGDDGRVAWTLLSAGLEDVKILNGSWNEWVNSEFEVSKEAVEPLAKDFKVDSIDDSLNITTDDLKSKMDTVKIVDTRGKDEFDGAINYGEKRGGHIPNAILIEWTELLETDGKAKSQEEIESVMDAKGISKDDEIVTYCTGGIRSAHMALVLRMAGYDNAVNYDASFYEWAGNENLPLE